MYVCMYMYTFHPAFRRCPDKGGLSVHAYAYGMGCTVCIPEVAFPVPVFIGLLACRYTADNLKLSP